MDIEEIYDFLIEFQGVRRSELGPKVDICLNLGIDGDDFFEMESEFAKRFKVNMDSYLWYFHHGEEGWNFGGIFFPPPYSQVQYIPVTPEILLNAANTNVWQVQYPDHEIKSRRAEQIINRSVTLLLILIASMSLYFYFSR